MALSASWKRKRPGLDPYDAKEQARGYAENLRAPFVILSNGKEHWFWNYERADQRDAFRIERLPSLKDLERLRLKNLQPPRPLLTDVVGPDYLKRFKDEITLRRYQINAIDEVSKQFDRKGKRKFLLEMATGTGKTLLCAALIRRFLATRNTGDVAHVGEKWAGAVAGYDLVVSPRERLTGEFVESFLLSEFIQEKYFNGLKLRAAQPHLNSTQVSDTPFLCPPLPLQREFASRVTEIHEIKTQQAASRERLDALFQSMLHRAFRGEL